MRVLPSCCGSFDLATYSVSHRKGFWGGCDAGKEQENGDRSSHHSPPLDPVLGHEVFGHGRRDLGHVVAVVFLAHAGSSVTTDGQAEISPRG